MHKVIKILGKTALTLILFVLISPFVLSLLLAVPGVQNYVADQAARFASRKLQTTVNIGHVDIGAGGRILIDDFYIEDLQQDTLLYARRLDATFPNFGLDGQGLNFSRSVLSGAKLYLRETESGEMNIRQVVQRLANPNREKKGNFRLAIGDLQVEDMTLHIERLEHRNPEYGVDYGNMRFERITARLNNFLITQPSGLLLIASNVQQLSLQEQSGFSLESLTGNFWLNNGTIGFSDMHLRLPNSDLFVPQLILNGGTWQNFKNYISEVEMEVAIEPYDDRHDGFVSTDDLAYFSPSLCRWKTTFKRPKLHFEGYVNDFHIEVENLSVGAHSGIVAPTIFVKGLPEFSTAQYTVSITTLLTRADDIIELARNIGGKELPLTTRRLLQRMGHLGANGIRFEGSLSDFETRINLHRSNVGAVRARAEMKPLRQASAETDDAQPYRQLTAEVHTERAELGRLLNKAPLLGSAAIDARLNGVVEHGLNTAQVNVNVTDLEFNGYRYDSIHLDGRLRRRGIRGDLAIVDPHISSHIDGEIRWQDSLPRYDITGRINHLDLRRLNFNRRDSLSIFSGRFSALASGRSLDDLNGEIQLHDVEYRYNDKRIESDRISLKGQNSATRKRIDLHSDFLNAYFLSGMSYRVVFDYLRHSARRYLPLIGSEQELSPLDAQLTRANSGYSVLDIDILDFTKVADAIQEGLEIAENSKIRMRFNPVSDYFSFNIESGYVQYARESSLFASRLHLEASNEQDSLRIKGGAGRLNFGRFQLNNFDLTGGAKLGNVGLTARFDNREKQLSAFVDLSANVARRQGNRGPHVDLNLHDDSYVARGTDLWNIVGQDIRLDSTRVEIGRFMIRNGDQQLTVDGVASRSMNDSLRLHLRNFEIAPILEFSDRIGYNISGRMQGEAMMTSVFDHGIMSADITLDELAANNLVAPPMRLTAEWDFQRNRAEVGVHNQRSRQTIAEGFFSPRSRSYGAHLQMDSLDMALLNPILSGVISDAKGNASVDLEVEGVGAEPIINGTIRIKDFSTKVDYTQVNYSIPAAKISVKNSLFSTGNNVYAYDRDGNRGRFSLSLDLQHLSNIGYKLRLNPQQLLVLDTDVEDNSMFHGRVYATGTATIEGQKGEVNMTINGTTDDNSLFFMPLEQSINVAKADFVHYVQPKTEEVIDLITEKERQFDQRIEEEQEEAATRMKITLGLNVQPNVELQMTIADSPIKVRGEGQLNMNIEPQAGNFGLYGTYNISEGTYDFSLQNFISKSFVIEDGSTIMWNGDPLNDANLNIRAVYTVKTSLQPLLEGMTENIPLDRSTPVDCRILLSEHLTNPDIRFEVDVPDADPETKAVIATVLNSPEAVDMQFLYLFVLGNFMADNSLTASANNPGMTASAATGVQFLTNQLSRLLSFSDYNVVIRYRPKTEVASDELDFGLSKSLINNRLLVEVEGNYLLDEKQTANSQMSNFMGEAYVTYLIDRSGALRLRAFTQTIDRFDENQGLQETGVGVYYKEDFENLRDLRNRIKDRFTSKRRREKREARARAAQTNEPSSPTERGPMADEEE